MDGIPSGFASVTPILPETMLISEKGGITGPQVEIMPLPDNSFNSGDTSTELLNNPFSLDIKGYERDPGKNVGEGSQPAGRAPASEEPAHVTTPGDAYTLSLSGGDDASAAPEMALELTRMKNYEMLGKAAARRLYHLNPESHSAEPSVSAGPEEVNTLISDRIRSFLAESAAIQNGLPDQTAAPSATGYEEAVETPQAPQGKPEPNQAPQTGRQPQQTLISGALAFQLTPSDYEAILTLEPDLQEALLNMLGSSGDAVGLPGQISTGSQPAVGNQPSTGNQPTGSNQPTPGNRPIAVEPQGTPAVPSSGVISVAAQGAQPDIAAALLGGGEAPPQDVLPPRIGVPVPGRVSEQTVPMSDAARLFTDTDAAAAGLAAASVTAGRPVLSDGMANLQKITELPYSLYLFGGVTPEKHFQKDEDEEETAAKKPPRTQAVPSEYLKLSEAVRMAAVLHHIYHGGRGFFPQDTPWYAPYVQYAIRHDIILNGEFDDFNDYATRAETAYIFSNAVPRAELPAVNATPQLADIGADDEYGDAIYLLHRAGVLITNDAQGRFYPESLVTRSEAAALIGRIATPGDRKRSAGLKQ